MFIDSTTTLEAYILLFLYILLLTYGTYKLVQKIREDKKNAIQQITINHKGIHYHKLNGNIVSILYSELTKSDHPYTEDIYAKTIGINESRRTVLKLFHKGIEKSVPFQHTNIFFTQLSINTRELRSHFIQGITLFRPDLKISQQVFTSFFINPTNSEFDKKKYIQTIFLAIILIIIIITLVIITL
ncbi:hypothetical protein HX017_01880 [Myroides marinus]|uniref:hypothetical protein n=1 Tax=Myroides marinus TaxID=703342 RepID=UPI002577C03B|nr:hypothetical protein [Myroides marinus]MDM1345872.1 hypothetical protein [Myroides marinus]MDM1349267.1 hypothetical protein [Myroides marinus]MDM1356477.1 hypothetical protein [Myroides marinus]MDM1363702.1 hypothetical protein [Myroides marinus]MDM1367864.1 hypothetical protein [Myroides marinus]